jgi:hypothetical protein
MENREDVLKMTFDSMTASKRAEVIKKLKEDSEVFPEIKYKDRVDRFDFIDSIHNPAKKFDDIMEECIENGEIKENLIKKLLYIIETIGGISTPPRKKRELSQRKSRKSKRKSRKSKRKSRKARK